MKADDVESPGKHNSNEMNGDDTQKLPVLRYAGTTSTLEKTSPMASHNSHAASDDETTVEVSQTETTEAGKDSANMPADETAQCPEKTDVEEKSVIPEQEGADNFIEQEITAPLPGDTPIEDSNGVDSVSTVATVEDEADEAIEAKTTLDLPLFSVADENSPRFVHPPQQQKPVLSRGRAILLATFLVILILNAV